MYVCFNKSICISVVKIDGNNSDKLQHFVLGNFSSILVMVCEFDKLLAQTKKNQEKQSCTIIDLLPLKAKKKYGIKQLKDFIIRDNNKKKSKKIIKIK